jgi:hypothetical protein
VCHLGRNLLHDFLPLLYQHSRDCSDRLLIRVTTGEQRAMHRNGRQVFGGYLWIPQVRPLRNPRRLESRLPDLHRGSVLNRKKPKSAGLDEPLDGRVTESAHPEDCRCLPVRESVIRILFSGTDKMEVVRVQTEMILHPQKSLKLSAGLRQSDSFAPQIG